MNILDFIDQSMHHQDVLSYNLYFHNNLLLLIMVSNVYLYVVLCCRAYLLCLIVILYLDGLVFSFMDIYGESNRIGSLHLPILFSNWNNNLRTGLCYLYVVTVFVVSFFIIVFIIVFIVFVFITADFVSMIFVIQFSILFVHIIILYYLS